MPAFVPDGYEKHLVPLIFAPYAKDLAARTTRETDQQLLELACGTGVLTRELISGLPSSAALVVTDYSESMLDFAKTTCESMPPEGPNLKWQIADGSNLPFEDGRFDTIVCQFGLMFFPDKERALSEAKRVLRPGGRLIFNVWGTMQDNPIFFAVESALKARFPEEEGLMLPTPCSMADEEMLQTLMKEAGFKQIVTSRIQFPVCGHPAAQVASGFLQGTPISGFLVESGISVQEMHVELEELVRNTMGDPIETSMLAIVCEAVA